MSQKATIYEQVNGLPEEGDYCGGEGYLWLIESIDSRIQTGDPAGNYVLATVSLAEWDDCAEGDEHTARVATRTHLDDERDAAEDRAADDAESRWEQDAESRREDV